MASVSAKDTALTLPTQSPGEGLPPWPLPAHRLPQRPQPTNLSSSCRRTKAGEAPHLLSSKFQSSAPGWQQPRKPGSPPNGPRCQGALPPVPLRARRRRRALRIPHAPEPFAGSHKGPVSWRRSAGNQPGPWPAAPLPIQLAPAPPRLPLQPLGRAGKGAQGPWYRPSSSRGRVGVARVPQGGRRPLAQQLPISIYPPSPTTGATCFTFLDVWERAEA